MNDYDTHEAYNSPLKNSTERLFNKAQKSSKQDNWRAYTAGQVPGGGAWGDDGRVGAFYTALDQTKAEQPDLNQLISLTPDQGAA